MNLACKRLSPERHSQIMAWVLQLNAEAQLADLQVGDRVLINNWPHTDRLGPYLIESIEGDTAKVEGFAQLLSICELRRA